MAQGRQSGAVSRLKGAAPHVGAGSDMSHPVLRAVHAILSQAPNDRELAYQSGLMQQGIPGPLAQMLSHRQPY